MKPNCFGKNNCVNIRWYKCEFSKGCLDEWEELLHNSNKTGEKEGPLKDRLQIGYQTK